MENKSNLSRLKLILVTISFSFSLTGLFFGQTPAKSNDIIKLFNSNLLQIDPTLQQHNYIKQKPYIFENDSLLILYKDQIPDSSLLIFYLAKGFFWGTQGISQTEIKYYSLADSIANNLENFKPLIKEFLSSYYYSVGQYKKTLLFSKEQISKYIERYDTNSTKYFNLLTNIGGCYNKLKQHDSAIFNLKKVIHYDVNNIEGHLIISNSYLQKNNIKKSEFHAKEIIRISKLNDLTLSNNTNAYLMLGLIKLKKEEYYSAIFYFDKAKSISTRENNYRNLKYANKGLLKTFIYINGDTTLFEHLDGYESANNSIISRRSQSLETKYQIQYETKLKERKINDLLITNKIERFIFWIAILIATITLTILTFILYRIKTQKTILSQELELKKIKTEQQNKKIQSLIEIITQKEKLFSEAITSNNFSKEIEEELINFIEKSRNQNLEWTTIISLFDERHPEYIKELEAENKTSLTFNEKKISILLKLKHSSKEISEVLFVSIHAIKKARQRLNKKLNNFEE